MRVISWNMRRAGNSHPAWDVLLDMNPDIALLQEIGEMPQAVEIKYKKISKFAAKKQGGDQNFSTAVLFKGDIVEEISLSSKLEWVNPILKFFEGNFIGCIVQLKAFDKPINVFSIYSPAWSVDQSSMNNQIDGVDLSNIQLKENPMLWPTEIIWLALKEKIVKDSHWIVGGDYNSSPRFDERKADGSLFPPLYRGTTEVLQRMKDLGFSECLATFNGKSIPTYKNNRSKRVEDQLDHLFATQIFTENLIDCRVGDKNIFEENISDHLPIIADFGD
jgi:exonuclease III